MSFKTVFIISITILVTIIMMNNTDEVNFWIFGLSRISMLAIMGFMFVSGLIAGFMLGRSGKKPKITEVSSYTDNELENNKTDGLSDEDREYIK